MKKVKFPSIEISDVWAALFPSSFHDKYLYLGYIPWNEEEDIHKAMEPLIIFMDYKARPWWCPRFVLRLLHLFGNDNSVARVRNYRLSNLKSYLTKGYFIWDYKTKWTNYDLRISISGDEQTYSLLDAIESHFYEEGSKENLASRIKFLDPETVFTKEYNSEALKKELERLNNKES